MRERLRLRAALLLLCTFLTLFASAQSRKVTGTINDNQGNPLSGATVTLKGTQIMATTDIAGKFSLTTSGNEQTLVISYVGMQTREVQIGSDNTVAVSLAAADGALSDVVVVGYGSVKRSNLTTAQTSISSKEIEKTVNTTIEQAIQGRASGVYVTQNSGQPGGGISINIRGISSINGNTEPLYVIDGVQIRGGGTANSSNPLAFLNPNDISDIQILQGPSATAIYGSQATNGVVLVTTKRGKNGDFRINYNVQYNIQTPPKRFEVMDLQQYAQMQIDYKAIAGGTVREDLLDPSILGYGTDWQDQLFNNAAMQKHQLSVSGGSDKTTYYMSGEYLDQQGVAEGSGFKRYSFRMNLDNKPREWLTIGANLSFNQTNESLTTSQENVIVRAIQLSPEVPVKNLDGEWGGGDLTNPAHQFSPVNPIAISKLVTNTSTRRQFLGGLNMQFNLAKGLVAKTSLNTSVGQGGTTLYMPTYAIGWSVNSTASLTNGTSENVYWNWNQLLEYNKAFGKHNLGLMVSHESQASKWKNVSGTRTGFLTNDIFDLNAGDATTATNNGGSGNWGMESYLGRLTYNYDSRYLLTGTVRRDGSVNFGPEKRWGTFPSVSFAWKVSSEEFFKVGFISDLKLRLETGLTGNQPGGNAAVYAPLSAGATPWGTGFLPSIYPNPLYQWEETNTRNIGLNIGFLNNRITIEGDYYKKYTTNLLMDASFPWYMGTTGTGSVRPPTVNAGNLETNGWGITINTINVNNSDFRWETNLNISQFKSVVKSLNTENAFFERSSWWLNQQDPWTQRSAIGLQPWLFRGYKTEGVFTSLEEIENSPVPVDNNGQRRPTQQNGGIWIGDVKYTDVNGDGLIDINDKTYIGNPWPKLFGGFTNTFSYKSFDLSILITATYGNDIYNFTAWENSNPNNINLGRNMLIEAMDYARITMDGAGKPTLMNPGTTVPRIISGADVNGTYARITDRYVEDGSYIRFKNISLSYNVPADVMKRVKFIKGARATVGAQNIYTITNYKGFDPEVGAYVGRDASNTNQAIGLDYGRYPLTPIYTFSLNVNF
ncbi:MAG: TonB-dependent receptor [Pedobacter sp.]|nr:MAG: TonB-dependent receptor [Pedobacter sp.]